MADPLSRLHLERQLKRVRQVTVFSYLFMALAAFLLLYGVLMDRPGFILAALAWFVISRLQRFRAARVRTNIEARLRALEEGEDSSSR